MTARPAVTTAAANIYDSVGPALRSGDEAGGSLLLRLIAAGTRHLANVEAIVRDDPESGVAGWSRALNLDTAPAAALPWAGQWVGVTPRPELQEADQRARIRDRREWIRATPAYFLAVAREYLTGGRRVELYERTGPSGHEHERATVRVFAAEVPDEARLRAAMDLASGWVRLTVDVVQGQSYAQLGEQYATFDDLTAAFATFDDMTYSLPPEA